MSRSFLRFVLALVLPSCVLLAWSLAMSHRLRSDLGRDGAVAAAGTAARILALEDGAPDTATSLRVLPAATGRTVGLYREGRRIAVWGEEARLPESLEGAERVVHRPVAGFPDLSVAVARPPPPGPPFPRPVLLVMGLLFLFSLVGGWMLLTHHPRDRRTGGTAVRLVLVGLLPAGMAVAALAYLGRDGEERVRAATVRSLAEAAAITDGLDLLADVERAATVTGLRVVRLDDAPATLSSLRPPPPGYTSTGRVVSGGEPHLYLITRNRRTGGATVFLVPDPAERTELFRLSLLLGLCAALTWIGVGLLPALSRPGPVRSSGRDRAGGPPPPP